MNNLKACVSKCNKCEDSADNCTECIGNNRDKA